MSAERVPTPLRVLPAVSVAPRPRGAARRAVFRVRDVDELRMDNDVLRLEFRRFAVKVRTRSERIYLSTVAERPDVIAHEAAALNVEAGRRLRQLGGDDAA